MAIFPIQITPLIVPGIGLWLDGVDPNNNNTQPSNSSSISTWVDKSGNGLNFTQATGANQPIFISNAINGKASLSFNGITQYLEHAFSSTLNPASCEVFVVCQIQGNAGNFRTPYASRKTVAGQLGFIFYATASNVWEFDYGDGGGSSIGMTTSVPTTIGTPIILDAQFNNSSQVFYINGISQATSSGAFLPNLTQPTRIGTINETTPTFYFNGYVGEIISYSINLSASQRALIYHYLSNKWGI